jgi:hypothetical protein
LEALILRMLSEYPSVRGSAGELAEALEQAEKSAGPVADERVRPSRLAIVEEEEQADAGVEERTVGLADAGVDDSVLAAAEAHSM